MSPLETKFRQSCKDCIEAGINSRLPPVEIIAQLNTLLTEYSRKAVHAGLSDDLATKLHSELVKAISEIVPAVALYEGPLYDTEHAILMFFRNESARCLPKRAVALGIPAQFQPEFPNALLSLYRRGLLKDDELNVSICLTSAGRGFVDG
jgi:hypothetical protein